MFFPLSSLACLRVADLPSVRVFRVSPFTACSRPHQPDLQHFASPHDRHHLGVILCVFKNLDSYQPWCHGCICVLRLDGAQENLATFGITLHISVCSTTPHYLPFHISLLYLYLFILIFFFLNSWKFFGKSGCRFFFFFEWCKVNVCGFFFFSSSRWRL